MTLKHALGALVLAAAMATPVAMQAETKLSQSNNPGLALGSELTALFAQERTAMKSADTRSIEAILASARPKAKPTQPKIDYSEDFLAGLPKASGGEQFACLAEALYFEARGESVEGQFAVAEVILNRVSSPAFPDTVCGVVNQGTGRKFQCQFTYTCDGHAEAINEPRAFDRVAKVARVMLDGAPRRLTDGATHYHTDAVSPRWSRSFSRTAQIGDHFFYRMPQAS